MEKSNEIKAPGHLKTRTKAWFESVCEEYDVSDHHIRVLTLAAESWDRCTQARLAIKRHGLTYDDRFGAPHARPEVAIERDSRIAFTRCLRELGLDLSDPDGRRQPKGTEV